MYNYSVKGKGVFRFTGDASLIFRAERRGTNGG